MDGMAVSTTVGIAGFVIGLLFGAVTRWGDFCALGALADIRLLGDFRRLRTWLLAIAVAIAGAHVLHGQGAINLHDSIYLSSSLGWFGAVFGGLMFGYGTVMARGCGGRSLIRLAGGDLRALIIFLSLGIFAYMTLRGLTGAVRVELEAATNLDLQAFGVPSQGIVDILGAVLNIDADRARPLLAVFVVTVILWFCLKDAKFRSSPKHVTTGITIGFLVISGWAATGLLGADEFEPAPLASLTFVRPVGDSIQYLMTFTGATVTFGIAVVGGTLVGGFAVAKLNGTFRLEGFSTQGQMIDAVLGGALMGVGGVLALGCTIGQGVTGISTLSVGSFLSLASILMGGALAISRLGLNTADEALGPLPGE